MKNSYPIHDLFINKLETNEMEGVTSLPLLSFDDHLLRRFGFAESISLKTSFRGKMKVRAVADEVWACISGKVHFHWWDLRSGSPSYDIRYEYLVEKPTLVLAPFGVGFGFETHDEPVQMIRFSTHPEGIHEGDYEIPREKD